MSDCLPPDIWVNILQRLSVKSLGKCARVCREWKSLTTDHVFISEHCRRNIQANEGNRSLLLHLSLLRTGWRDPAIFVGLFSLHFDNEQFDLLSNVKSPFVSGFSSGITRVVGTCNGLVCLVDNFGHNCHTYIIWNPSIRKYVILPKPRATFKRSGYYEPCVGFGFDYSTRDFKVVRFMTLFAEGPLPGVEVYSLATGSWRRITAKPPPFLLCKDQFERMQTQICMSGIIHWVVTQRRDGHTYNFILSFNVVEETFGEMILPQTLRESRLRVSILEGGEKLAVAHMYYPERGRRYVNIWVMKEYGVVGSWEKVFQIDPSRCGGIKRILALTNTKKLVLVGKRGEIISVDQRNNLALDLEVREAYCPFVGYHVESLFLLNKEDDAVSY